MLSRTAPRILRYAARPSLRSTTTTHRTQSLRRISPAATRPFHASTAFAKGIQPDSEDPQPPSPSAPVAGAAAHVTEPTPLTPEEYQDYSEHYFNVLLGELERSQEEGSDVEAEYSVSSAPASLVIWV